ncbi:response regulator [Alkalimarinus coralli]|uniref:response regulator n=1 Tax=Alkalimarinus coralli TaxID=2935863 RepID=UPI00202B610C|nr:response regulator [Alkalimarinus coralli]
MSTAKSKSTSLGNQLTFWFLLLSLLPLALVAWISYQQANSSLTQAASEELELSAKLNVSFIQTWFSYRFADLHTHAENNDNTELLERLTEGLRQSGQLPHRYVKSNDWLSLVESSRNELINLSEHYNYIYDLFLIDSEGNILYTVAKESDLGGNLFSGPLGNTLFAKSVKKSLISGQAQFSDLEHYLPSNNAISGFLTAPMKNESGQTIGVFAIQIKLNQIFELLHNETSSNVKHYLVGQDGLLRTPISNNQAEVLTKSIASIQYQAWRNKDSSQNQSQESISVSAPEGSAFSYLGAGGKHVIGLRNTVNIANTQWLLISEVNQDIALSDARWLGQVVTLLVFLTGLVVIIIAIYQSRRITRPITKLAKASMAVAEGEKEQQVEVGVNNEIGRLAEAFNHMLTMRKLHEQELEKSHQESQQALANLADQRFALDQHAIVTITDVDGIITYANENFAKISGYSVDELIGQTHQVVNSGFHDNDFFKDIYDTITRGQVWHGEICNKSKQGDLYWVDSTIVPFMGQHDKPQSYIAIRTDITKRKETQATLLEAKNAAEAAVEAKGEFLASMSHEIRTPMNGVLGMLGLLINSDLSDKQRHKVLLAQSSAQSLLALINDILDFSKVDAGKIELELMDFNLRALLGDFAEAMALKAQEKNIELVLDITNIDQSSIKGDPGRLRQILTNIVGNAIKFTESGEVIIAAGIKETASNKATFYCSIQDTGIGIPANKRATLFDPFTQVDASTTRKYGGTGLGLSIVKKLCELMGGSISVSSQPGKGSHFEFTLTFETSEHSVVVKPPTDITNLNILVVDDNNSNRNVLVEQLKHWGANVVSAESGKAALDYLNKQYQQPGQHKIDIALIDMQMPEMSGKALGKAIRSNTCFDAIKLVMMTSMGHRGDTQYFANLGFCASFPKPTTTSDLFNALTVATGDIYSNQPPKSQIVQQYLDATGDCQASTTSGKESDQIKWPSNTRLLLVEDNHVNQQVALGVLDNIGLTADVAGDGIEALYSLNDAPEENPYTLVLMDCQMPEMDGYEASQNIRAGKAGERNQSIPIIAMTANAMKGDKEKCLSAGMSDYLSKPVEPDDLYSMMEKWLVRPAEEELPATHAGDATTSLSDTGHQPDEQAHQETSEREVWDRTSALKRVGGKEKRLDKLLSLFLSDTSNRVLELHQNVKEKDSEKVRVLAHTIKGSAANISALQLQQIAGELEAAAQDANLSRFDALSMQLSQAFESLKECLSQHETN